MSAKATHNNPLIDLQSKEHLKALFADFLSNKEYRELKSGWLREDEMMISLCAAYGKFDFSVVLEHFADLMSALKFIGRPNEFMNWEGFIVRYAAYWLLDCPLLCETVGSNNNFGIMKKQLEQLLLNPSYWYHHKAGRSVLNDIELPKPIPKALDKNDLSAFRKILDDESLTQKIIANIAYAALCKEKWDFFSTLHARYDVTQYADMEKIFEFWSNELLYHWWHDEEQKGNGTFAAQWQEPEKYPLHRMMIEYGRERSIPVLYAYGYLLPEVIEYLWYSGISFDVPLMIISGWENVTFPAFASCFGDLDDKIQLIPVPKYTSAGDMIFRQNVKSAAFFNAYSASHPRQMPAQKSIPVAKTKKGELTPEQKVRLATDEAYGVVFSSNKKILKSYTTCTHEPEEWVEYSVPDFVTAIAAEAFYGIEGLRVESVILPEGLVKIGPRAFSGTDIKKVAFPSSLKTICKEAFYFSLLKELRLPEGISKIEEGAFACCSELQSVFLPDSLEELGRSVFINCSKLTSVRLPLNLNLIPDYTFQGCKKLEKIIISDGVQEIQHFPHFGEQKSYSVEVPYGIKIHKDALKNHNQELKIIYRPPKEE